MCECQLAALYLKRAVVMERDICVAVDANLSLQPSRPRHASMYTCSRHPIQLSAVRVHCVAVSVAFNADRPLPSVEYTNHARS